MRLSERQAKFLREVGGIVLGVLIALGIGEAADAIRWKFRVDASLDAVRLELSGNRFSFVERRAYQSCLNTRLNELGSILMRARASGSLPRLQMIGRPGFRAVEATAFEVAKSEGVPLHMNRDQARAFASAYLSVDIYARRSADEAAAWDRLVLLEGLRGEVSGDLLTSMLESWADARASATTVGQIAELGDEELAALGVGVEDGAEAATRAGKSRPICKPLLVDGKPFELSRR